MKEEIKDGADGTERRRDAEGKKEDIAEEMQRCETQRGRIFGGKGTVGVCKMCSWVRCLHTNRSALYFGIHPATKQHLLNTKKKKEKKDLHSSPCRPRWIWVENRTSDRKPAADAETTWMLRRLHF